MLTLHEYPPSGNCYKVRLLLAQRGLAYQRVLVDLTKGEGKTEEFRARFPLGRVPVLVLDDGQQLAESNAILWYLGEGTPFVPADKLSRSRMMQWMFWEQYSHEPYVAVARAWLSFFGVPSGKDAELRERQQKAMGALEVMDRHLREHAFFAGEQYSLADIALYAYTHVAPEGGLDLRPFSALRAWLDRVKAQPGYVPLSA